MATRHGETTLRSSSPPFHADAGGLLHVHDLPQLYTRPSFQALSSVLDLLRIQPASFSAGPSQQVNHKVDPEGVPRYLTTIVSSSLSWLEESQREVIWDLASARMSERSGRNAMPSMTRSFYITEDLTIQLFEPSLTEDNLGLKTWTSSLLLAKRLPLLRHHLPIDCDRILELGSGTGLVGIAAARLWNVDVVLTDLPEIVSNLERNVDSNAHVSRRMHVRPLDWSDASDSPKREDERYSVVLAADPIYSSDHPRMLVDALSRWSTRQEDMRFIVELPLRGGYESERMDLRRELQSAHMLLIEEGTEIGHDDWEAADGRPVEVECWWSVWRYSIADIEQIHA